MQRVAARGGSGNGAGAGDKRKARSRAAAGSRGWGGDEAAQQLALETIDNYARSLRVGSGGGVGIGVASSLAELLCITGSLADGICVWCLKAVPPARVFVGR